MGSGVAGGEERPEVVLTRRAPTGERVGVVDERRPEPDARDPTDDRPPPRLPAMRAQAHRVTEVRGRLARHAGAQVGIGTIQISIGALAEQRILRRIAESQPGEVRQLLRRVVSRDDVGIGRLRVAGSTQPRVRIGRPRAKLERLSEAIPGVIQRPEPRSGPPVPEQLGPQIPVHRRPNLLRIEGQIRRQLGEPFAQQFHRRWGNLGRLQHVTDPRCEPVPIHPVRHPRQRPPLKRVLDVAVITALRERDRRRTHRQLRQLFDKSVNVVLPHRERVPPPPLERHRRARTR